MMPIKQWVNLDRNDPEILRTVPEEGVIPPERCGPRIDLEATISETQSGTRLRGRPIWWGVVLGGDNIPDTAGGNSGWNHRVDRSGDGWGGAEGLYEIASATGMNSDNEAVATASFSVSGFGGNTYDFKAYTKNDQDEIETEIAAQQYEVWRVLYYQVTRMRGNGDRPAVSNIDWSQVEAEFQRDLRHIKWCAVPASQELINHITLMWDPEDQWNIARDGYDRAREPLVVKVSLVDVISFQDTDRIRFQAVRRGQEPMRGSIDNILFDAGSPDDRDDWFINFTGQEAGDSSRSIVVSRDDVRKINPNTIEYTPSGRFPRCTTGNMVLDVRIFGTGILGTNQHNAVWIAGSELSTQTDQQGNLQYETIESDMRVRAAIHEFGHALGLVDPGCSTHYTGHGHIGNHCFHPQTRARTSYLLGEPTTCVMFGDITRGSVRSEFCTNCADQVRAPIPLNMETFTREPPIPNSGRPAPPTTTGSGGGGSGGGGSGSGGSS